jgi:hypothetical protein
MGIWGTGPFDSDSAGDMLATLAHHVNLAATRKTNETASYHYAAARAVIPLLVLSHSTDILGGPSLEPALKALVRMRLDDVWLSGWRTPKKIAAVLDRELDQVLARMATCRRCKKKLSRDPNRGLPGLVALAKSHPVPRQRGLRDRLRATASRRRRARARLKLPKKKARAGRRRGP